MGAIVLSNATPQLIRELRFIIGVGGRLRGDDGEKGISDDKLGNH